MITNSAKEDIATEYIATYYRLIKIGDGADSTSASQTTLDHSVTSKSDITPTVVGSTLIWTVDFEGSEIPSSGISELGVFKNDGSKLLSRVTFTSTGVVAASDTVTFSIRVELD